ASRCRSCSASYSSGCVAAVRQRRRWRPKGAETPATSAQRPPAVWGKGGGVPAGAARAHKRPLFVTGEVVNWPLPWPRHTYETFGLDPGSVKGKEREVTLARFAPFAQVKLRP